MMGITKTNIYTKANPAKPKQIPRIRFIVVSFILLRLIVVLYWTPIT